MATGNRAPHFINTLLAFTKTVVPMRTQPAGPSQGMFDTHSAADAALMASTTGSPSLSNACTLAIICPPEGLMAGVGIRFGIRNEDYKRRILQY